MTLGLLRQDQGSRLCQNKAGEGLRWKRGESACSHKWCWNGRYVDVDVRCKKTIVDAENEDNKKCPFFLMYAITARLSPVN